MNPNPFRTFLLFLDKIIHKILWLTAKHNYTEYRVSGCTFTEASTYGIWLDADTFDNVFLNNTASNCYDSGITIDSDNFDQYVWY